MPSTTTIPATSLRNEPATTWLRGRWLTLAHVGWIVIVLFDIASFVPGALLYNRLVHIPCADTEWNAGNCVTGQLSPSAMQQLSHLGVSLDLYAALALAIVLFDSAVFFASGFLIARRRWGDGMGLFVSLVLVTFAAGGLSSTLTGAESALLPTANPMLASILSPFGLVLSVAIWPALGAFLLTFPTGRFTPRWSWLLIGLWITNFFAFVLQTVAVITYLSVAITYSSVIAVQVYRYRRVYTSVERQQTKWLVFTIGAAVLFLVLIGLLESVVPSLGSYDSLFYFIADLVSAALFFLSIAVAVAIALLRYRLYDIDVIIRRTLVYGLLTAILAAIYFVGVVGTQTLIGSISGHAVDQAPLAIVATTLVIAALFQPLRSRLQQAIDRRFFRGKYDAERTLATFGAALRSEVELTHLSERLVTAVEETMQPEQVSLWLRAESSTSTSRPQEVPR